MNFFWLRLPAAIACTQFRTRFRFDYKYIPPYTF